MKTADLNKLKLGDKVQTYWIYKRQRTKNYKYWQFKFKDKVNHRSVECIFLGFRTIFDGYVYNDGGYGIYFHQTKIKRAALVCANVNENPFYTPVWGLWEGE